MVIRYDVIFDGIDGSGKTPSVNLLKKIWFTKLELKQILLSSSNIEELIYNIKILLDNDLKLVVWDRFILTLYFILKFYYSLSVQEIKRIYEYLFRDYNWKVILIFLDSSREVLSKRIIQRGYVSENDLKLIKNKDFYEEYKQIFEEAKRITQYIVDI